MKTKRTLQAKIVQHSAGLGVPNSDVVRQRAMELAMIDGRSTFNEQDWQQARIELHGGHSSPGDDGEEDREFVSARDIIAGTRGHHTENQSLDDAQNIVEELISEGMDEAVHDQMLEASKLQDGTEDI